MTFDFSPDRVTEDLPLGGASAAVGPVSLSPPMAPPRIPSHPSLTEVASLVRELFSEGTLSWDQLSELARVPELRTLLEDTVAGVPAGRRLHLPR